MARATRVLDKSSRLFKSSIVKGIRFINHMESLMYKFIDKGFFPQQKKVGEIIQLMLQDMGWSINNELERRTNPDKPVN
ncbi:hypothetical protein PRIPAC_79768 [Pristionchus pacificus]|uniref:Uncharacterized protein n=1 Tax=Pristionchus pacificus TaxID=54126 RepID=A0A2A6C355_PRIPA|nr:hypothetical protein PRIPAC_79768 [Pristionchus pacificus]|eukprot:PDM72549.1 hypothetical protein PRIPAC_38983 [Pristionchus pacificus]